jgi:iron(III) transport system permease protein
MSDYSQRVSFKDTLISKLKENIIFIILYMLVIIFILWPIISVAFNSIYINDNFSLEAYKELTLDNTKLLGNSIFIAIASTFFAILISIVISIYLTQFKSRMKKFIYSSLLISMISPPFVASLAFIILFGRRGLITYNFFHLDFNPYGWQGIVLMETLGCIPIATLLIVFSIRSIDNRIIQASNDLGADDLSTLLYVILPMAKPGIIVASLICFVTSLSDFGTPIIIGGGFNVLATEAYLNVTGVCNLPLASAMCIFLLLPSFLLFILYRKQMSKNKMYSYQSFSDNQLEDNKLKLPICIKIFISFITYLFIIFVILKYLTIIAGGFASFDDGKISFTLDYFKKIDYAKFSSFERSIIYSFISAIVGSILGMLISYSVEMRKIKFPQFLDFITTLPYMLPGTLFGIGYILSFKNPPLQLIGTSAIVILNCIFKQLPISTKAGSEIISQLNPEIENAAKDIGAGNFYVIKDIILPMLKPAFLISFINIFTSTMVTIGALIFLISPGKEVATIQLFSAIKQGDLGVGCVIASMIIFVTVFVNLGLTSLLKVKYSRE